MTFEFITHKHDLLVCNECGTWTKLHASAWVDPNTGKVTSLEGPTEAMWCDGCEAEAEQVYSTEAKREHRQALLGQLDRLQVYYRNRFPDDGHLVLAHLVHQWSERDFDQELVSEWLK